MFSADQLIIQKRKLYFSITKPCKEQFEAAVYKKVCLLHCIPSLSTSLENCKRRLASRRRRRSVLELRLSWDKVCKVTFGFVCLSAWWRNFHQGTTHAANIEAQKLSEVAFQKFRLLRCLSKLLSEPQDNKKLLVNHTEYKCGSKESLALLWGSQSKPSAGNLRRSIIPPL